VGHSGKSAAKDGCRGGLSSSTMIIAEQHPTENAKLVVLKRTNRSS
jgi:hypothetical protein